MHTILEVINLKFENQRLKEFDQFAKNKKVAIIGVGVSNIPLIDYFYNLGSKVTIFNDKQLDELPQEIVNKINLYGIQASLGKNYLSKLKGFDIIFRSPSCLPTVPELKEEIKRGALVTTEIEMVLKMCPCKVIGITGSEGKTTTTSIIYEVLKAGEYNCYLGGNIGIPLFTKIKEMMPDDIVVIELSSFQLMDMDVSPDIAIVTNITPNHLNVHSSYEEYIDAKKNIFKYQNENGILIINYDNEITKEFHKEATGKIIYFSSREKLENGWIVDQNVIKECNDRVRRHILNTDDLTLRGTHNYENICAALAATKNLVDIDTAVKAIREFNGVEHRLEFIREIDGVKWYNDSSSSSPTRTIAGLKAFNEDIILIAGGYDKNLDYTPIAKPILDKVKTLILIGDTATKIFSCVKKQEELQGKHIDTYVCDDLAQTVALAKKHAKPGQIVLFSPASASFDMFKNFADRGNKFKKLVNNME